MATPLFSHAIQTGVLIAILVAASACGNSLPYVETAVADRRANVLGLEALFLRHLDAHPEQFPVFIRIVTDADEALHSHRVLTRASVVRWIDRRAESEGFDERRLPGLYFLKNVYLAGWNHGYLNLLDENDRELLSDLITGVMGALHKCRTCSTAGAHQQRP
ncbi:MAG: hypothetical protein AB1451_10330 [Nitrospirota bacterium]